jgi:hypothetical protein
MFIYKNELVFYEEVQSTTTMSEDLYACQQALFELECAINRLRLEFEDDEEDILNASKERHNDVLTGKEGETRQKLLNEYFLALEVYEKAEIKYMGYE